MRKLISFILLASLSRSATAQSNSDIAAYIALMLTPVGALPPIMTSTIAASAQRSAQLALRFGYQGDNDILPSTSSFGVSGVLPMGTVSTVSLTGGINSPDCRVCDPGLMLAVGADTRLTEAPMGSDRNAARFTISLNGELGFGQFKNVASLVSGSVGLPVALVSGGRGAEMRIVPFLVPAFGFGNYDPTGTENSQSGSRFMLAGGVGIYNPRSSVSLNFGFQHVVIDHGGTQFGLALMLGGR